MQVLRTPVNITLRRLAHGSDAVSATWNFSLVGGQGGWQSGGCRILGHYDNFTAISCNSLGNYGLLMVGRLFSASPPGAVSVQRPQQTGAPLTPLCRAGPQQRGVLLPEHPAAAPRHLRHRHRPAALSGHRHHHLHVPSQVPPGLNR